MFVISPWITLPRGTPGRSTPRVLRELLHAELDLAALLVDADDHDLDIVLHLGKSRGVADLLGPRHVVHVHDAVDAFLDLEEESVRAGADHLRVRRMPTG